MKKLAVLNGKKNNFKKILLSLMTLLIFTSCQTGKEADPSESYKADEKDSRAKKNGGKLSRRNS